MSAIADQRCFNHGRREAVARCPRCGHFYCRECVVEHEGKVLCARCLASPSAARGRGRFAEGTVKVFAPLSGAFFLWLFFYYLGKALLLIPSSFHEGLFWK